MENDLDMALCEMTKQRDDLLEALKLVQQNLNEHGMLYADTVASINAAIAKAESN